MPICATTEPSHEPMRLELPAGNAAQDTSTPKPAPGSGDEIAATLIPDPQRG